jgi:hypothetical protein
MSVRQIIDMKDEPHGVTSEEAAIFIYVVLLYLEESRM